MCTECVIAPWPHTRTKELPFFLAGFGTDHFHWQDSGRHQIVPSRQGSVIVARVFLKKIVSSLAPTNCVLRSL